MKDACLLFNTDITPNLKQYVYLLDNVKFDDESHHVFYGEVKKIITSFLYYYTVTMDDIIIETDQYSHTTDRNELLCLMDKTIAVHHTHQISFGKDFLPVQSPFEKQTYDEIQVKYKKFTEELYLLKKNIENLDKKEKIENFAMKHFKIALINTSNVFKYTHNYISLMLADRLRYIQVSLEEILLRLRNNLRSLENKRSEKVNLLLNQLYDKNKEQLQITRQHRKCSIEYAEVNRAINVIHEKIEDCKYDVPISKLREEVEYWEERVKEFHKIADSLWMLKAERAELIKQEEIYKSMQSTELPGSKLQCWENMGENFKEKKEEIKQAINDAAKTLITFFCVKGSDRIFYMDDLGPYYLDEYNHQVYFFDYGMSIYHLNCQGDFKEISDKEKYRFDENGRYVEDESGQKVYRCAPCTSSYRLSEDGLLTKVTKDCGHSEMVNKKCRLRIKDPTDVEILPTHDKMNIKGKLDPEVVEYLWNSLGHVLPDALHDVARDHTRNPIQHLAHKLLLYKYNRTRMELREKMKEAKKYRANVYKERNEKASKASQAWMRKQVKRRKPEESDDTQDRFVFEAQMAAQDFINSLNCFNN